MNNYALSEKLIETCKQVLTELGDIIGIVERNLHTAELSRHLDTFFYIESQLTVRRIRDNLAGCCEPDSGLAKNLADIQSRVRTRWQSDYMLIATPPSLRPYLI